MSENKRYRVFKYIDCEWYGVSDDIAEYTLATFDNHIEAEGLCDRLNEQDERIKELEKDLNDALNQIEERSIDVQLLKEENGNLKKENELKGDFRNFINEDIVRIKKENEQLKLKVNGLKSELSIWKEDANEHIKEINKLFEENKQLKQELDSFEQVSFTNLCDKSKTILYMKKENVGDVE